MGSLFKWNIFIIFDFTIIFINIIFGIRIVNCLFTSIYFYIYYMYYI
jgi:hypothetical protein